MNEYFIQHGQVLLVDVARLCAWLAVLSIVFVPLERLFALRPSKILRPDIGIDLGYYFLNGLLPAMLMSAPLGLVAWAVHATIPPAFHGFVAGSPLWFRLLAGLVVGDLAYYWAHRAMHGVPFLWRFHAVHHSAGHIDFLVNTRAHPIDIIFSRLSGIVPLYVLGLAGPSGAGAAMPAMLILTGMTWSFFIHANVRWRLRWLGYVLSTPHFHHWHHTTDAPFNQNYASMLPVLDRLFGTLHVPDSQWPAGYGIQETLPHGMTEQLLQPFLDAPPTRAL